jgi:hypothetical protein
MRPMSRRRQRAKARGPQRFETPLGNRIGDCVIFLLGAPLCIGATWLLMMLPASILLAALELGDEAQRPVFLGALVPATAVTLWIFRRQFWWSLTLTGDAIQLGPRWIGIRIRYEDVRFLRLGALLERGRRSSPRSVPVRIETGWVETHRFMVAFAQADACLHALRHRCRQAPAVDVLGSPARDYLPLDPGSQAQGLRRLQRFWAVAGMLLASVVGSIIVVMLLALVDETSRQTFLARVEARPGALLGAVAGLAAGASFAWFCLRQSRKARKRN